MPPLSRTVLRALCQPIHRRDVLRRLRNFHAQPRSLEEVVDKALHFGSAGFYRIRTVQKRSEILRLARAVRDLRPEVILEIGTSRAGTLFIWSHLASRKAISCDIRDMHRQAPVYSLFPPPGSACTVTVLTGDSHQESMKQRVVAELAGVQVDFLFIDGDHTEKGATADFNDYRPLVRPGGIIAFHDIAERQRLANNQVQHLWKKLKPAWTTEEFIDDVNQYGYGIGIVRV